MQNYDQCAACLDTDHGRHAGGGIHPSYSYMYRWPDSDLPGRQHRQYEIAGAALGMDWDMAVRPCAEDLQKYNGRGREFPLERYFGKFRSIM